MREEKVLVKGIETNYKIGGEGENFLILHGWNGSSDSWKKIIEILEIKYKVVCPDFPGFGKTEIPKIPWSLNDFVEWLKEFTEKLNLKEFFLLGHSFGGRVAIKFSISYPEKIKKLILVSSGGIKQKWGLKEKIVFQLAKVGNAIFSKRPFFRFKDGARNFFYRVVRIKDYARARGIMKETMKKIVAEDLLPKLSKIQKETLIIWGEKDKILPLKYAFIFKENIENSKLEILPRIGHSPHLEDPEKLAEILISNLK
jgi:pimeloyl-ACP methyl ester carboxylesterase